MSNESEEVAALKEKIKQLETEVQQMKEAANKVMDSHEARQLARQRALHLTTLDGKVERWIC